MLMLLNVSRLTRQHPHRILPRCSSARFTCLKNGRHMRLTVRCRNSPVLRGNARIRFHSQGDCSTGETARETTGKAFTAAHPSLELGAIVGGGRAGLRWSLERLRRYPFSHHCCAAGRITKWNRCTISRDGKDKGWQIDGHSLHQSESCWSQRLPGERGRCPDGRASHQCGGIALHYNPGYGYGNRYREPAT